MGIEVVGKGGENLKEHMSQRKKLERKACKDVEWEEVFFSTSSNKLNKKKQ